MRADVCVQVYVCVFAIRGKGFALKYTPPALNLPFDFLKNRPIIQCEVSPEEERVKNESI